MPIAAVVAVIVRDGKTLFIARPPGPFGGRWGPVSGKVEPGEEQAAAVARESMEEVGLVVRPVEKVWENMSTSGRYCLHWWLAEYAGGELVLDPREVGEARWLAPGEIFALEIFEGDREFYQKVLPTLMKEK
jgi:8-oxo-dGTP pyrophosphatase MutT (NUDIX family)